MQLGNIGKLTILNGDVHFELDATIGGTVDAPLTADLQVGQLLTLLQEAVTNPLEKAALGMVIGLLGTVVVQGEEKSADVSAILQYLLSILPGLIQALLAQFTTSDPMTAAKLQLALIALKQ